jgi:hypothetical protein
MMWPAQSTTAEARAVGIGETKGAAVEQTLAGKSRELAANKKAAVWKVNLTGYVHCRAVCKFACQGMASR